MTTECFTTADLAPTDRLAFWNRIGCETFGDLAVESRPGAAFDGVLMRRPYGGVVLTQVTTSPAIVQGCARPSSLSDAEYASVMLQDMGTSAHVVDGQQVRMEASTVVSNLASRPWSIAFDETTRFVIVRVPLPLLASRLGHPRDLIGTRVEAREAVLLSSFLRQLAVGTEPERDADWDSALGDVIVDLIAIAYRARTALPALSATDDRWQRTVREFVDRHLGDPALGAAMIADRLGVSPRYIQMVFAKTATTASAYIRKRRLELAARLLVQTRDPILDVAARVGFSDLSTFYRGFRKQFGVSPKRYAETLTR